ncbi:hypothetical protein VTK26DRAFT_7506 [Humicola hyalothermophila]
MSQTTDCSAGTGSPATSQRDGKGNNGRISEPGDSSGDDYFFRVRNERAVVVWDQQREPLLCHLDLSPQRLRLSCTARLKPAGEHAFYVYIPRESVSTVDSDPSSARPRFVSNTLSGTPHSLRFHLGQNALFVGPGKFEEWTPKNKYSGDTLDALQNLARQTTFTLFLSQFSLSKRDVERICRFAWGGNSGSGTPIPAIVREISSLYGGRGGRIAAARLSGSPDSAATAVTAQECQRSASVDATVGGSVTQAPDLGGEPAISAASSTAVPPPYEHEPTTSESHQLSHAKRRLSDTSEAARDTPALVEKAVARGELLPPYADESTSNGPRQVPRAKRRRGDVSELAEAQPSTEGSSIHNPAAVPTPMLAPPPYGDTSTSSACPFKYDPSAPTTADEPHGNLAERIESYIQSRIEKSVEAQIQQFEARIEKYLEARLEKLEAHINGVVDRLENQIDGLRKELTSQIEEDLDEARTDLRVHAEDYITEEVNSATSKLEEYISDTVTAEVGEATQNIIDDLESRMVVTVGFT